MEKSQKTYLEDKRINLFLHQPALFCQVYI